MPYIAREARELYDDLILKLDRQLSGSAPDIAYVIFKLLCLSYGKEKYNWFTKSMPLKILEDVKLEWFDRILKPHSKKKIEENGDII